MKTPEIVADSVTFGRLCARVADADRVGVDTEFHAERTYSPRLMVVQLAFDDGAAIVDALALSDLRPLALALIHTTIIGHALSADLKLFADRFDLVPPRVFDTQIAAAFLGYGMQVSLAELVRGLRGVRLTKSHTVSDWSARPFSERQIEYLVDDVVHLGADANHSLEAEPLVQPAVQLGILPAELQAIAGPLDHRPQLGQVQRFQ